MGAMGAWAVLFVPQNANTAAAGSNAQYLAVWAVLYAFTAIFFLFKVNVLRWGELAVLTIPVLYTVSALWTHQPVQSAIYAIALSMNGVFAILLTRCYSWDEFPLIFGRLIVAVSGLGLCLFIVGFEPAAYIDPHGRPTLIGTQPLRGLFNHKITAGVYACIGFLLIYINEHSRLRRPFLAFLFLFILMTGSSFAVGLLIIGLILLISLRITRKTPSPGPLFLILFVGLILLGIVLFITIGTTVLVLLDRDPTLTGRTLLWEWGIQVGLQKPMFGWGYLGYNGSELAAIEARSIREFQNYSVPHFHNSYVQTFAEGGLFIFVLLLWQFGRSFLKWSRLDSIAPSASHLSYLVLIATIASAAIFMNVFFRYNELLTLIFMIQIAYSAQPDVPKVKASK